MVILSLYLESQRNDLPVPRLTSLDSKIGDMKVSLSSSRASEFACHSKACAQPPVGKGGSGKSAITGKDTDGFVGGRYKKGGPEPYAAGQYGHRKTSVTTDGTIAVSTNGRRLPLFKVRSSKAAQWVTDRRTTDKSRMQIRKQTVGWS